MKFIKNILIKIDKLFLNICLTFSSLFITYLIYIYPILNFIFKLNVIPHGHWFVCLFLTFVIFNCSLQLYVKYMPEEKDLGH